MEKKPWHKSKIFLAGLVMAAVAIGNTAIGFVTGQGVTPEQIGVIQDNYPAIAENVKDAVNGGNVLNALYGIGGTLIAIWRYWYTNTSIG
jgi:hypothetical protein